MKGGHKEGTKKQKIRKVHFVALMDIRHIQKYEYIPENVRESKYLKCGHKYEYISGECSREQSRVWKLSSPDERAGHELPEKIDEAGMKAEILNWYNH